MMCDMRGSNSMVEKVENTIRPVDGTQRSLDPSPLIRSILRDGRVAMLQPSVQNQPRVDNQVWVPVPQKNWQETKLLGSKDRQVHHTGQGGDGRNGDLGVELFREHGRGGTEMIHDSSVQGLSLGIEFSCRSQPHQVQGPSNAQMGPNLKCCKDTIAHSFMPHGIEAFAFVVFAETIVLGCRRNVRFAIGQMVGSSVVLGMGVLPGKVWDEQYLVGEETDNVVYGLGWRIGSMSALVSNHPRTGHNGSLPKGVECPSKGPQRNRRRVGKVRQIGRQDLAGAIGKGCGNAQVAHQIGGTPKVRPFKAMLGNRSLDFSLRGKFGGLGIQWVVGRFPYTSFIRSHHLGHVAFSSFAHLLCFVVIRFDKREEKKDVRENEIQRPTTVIRELEFWFVGIPGMPAPRSWFGMIAYVGLLPQFSNDTMIGPFLSHQLS
eukprot:scaffold4345_cov125-Cylindrotheca_fusiformis.AAC.4